MVQVVITAAAARQFDSLPLRVQVRMLAIFERLHAWPNVSGARALRGAFAGHHRIRTGRYRVLFREEGDLLVVVKVGHRDRFYEG